MKKRIITVITAVLMLSMALLAEAARLEFTIGESVADVDYNKKIGIVSYLSEQGNTMVGLRAVAETLDIEVEWNEAERKVILSDPELEMTVMVDSDTAIVNGQEVKMSEPARIYLDRTVVPIRFVSESFGAEVEYVEETKSVIVTAQTFGDRCEPLGEAWIELVNQYPDALKGFLETADEPVTLNDFENVWNSLVNTKIMELWPDKEFSAEFCDACRSVQAMDFSDRFIIYNNNPDEVVNDAEITEPITLVPKEWHKRDYDQYKFLTYNPLEKSIELISQNEVNENKSSGGGGGGASSEDYLGSSGFTTGSTVIGSAAAPKATMPPYAPLDDGSEVTVKDSEENISEETPKPQATMIPQEAQATAEPVPQIMESADSDEPSFDDMIDGL